MGGFPRRLTVELGGSNFPEVAQREELFDVVVKQRNPLVGDEIAMRSSVGLDFGDVAAVMEVEERVLELAVKICGRHGVRSGVNDAQKLDGTGGEGGHEQFWVLPRRGGWSKGTSLILTAPTSMYSSLRSSLWKLLPRAQRL